MFTNILAFNVKYKEFTVEIFKGNLLDFPANFICGFGVSSLHIYAVSQEPERQMFKHYARFCKKIKDANTVKKISLYIDTITSIENRTLMDLLPDAITELSGSPQGAQLMWKRQTVLETIEIKVEDTYDSINDVFVSVYHKPMLECRARHIKLKNDPYASSYVYGLDGMHDLYPMKKNPHLETLQVFARMISTIYEVREANEDYDNMKEDKVWLNGRLEKYKRAFKALNSLNPSLMLRVKDDQSYLLNLLTIGKVGEKLELFIENTAAFCQAAVDAQVNLKDVKVRIHMCLPTQGYLTEKWRGICLAQIEKRGFKDKDTSHNNYVAMDGKLILHNIPVNVRLFVMKGNLNEGAQDPFSGEWSSKEFQHSRSGITGDFY
ncbi:hypothetical protein M3Y97_00146700 [Aphelenchoides bicaudatus]|nr:hypothetical protein M3Y97_00146700 [Aphelenchoides bicaudatus]